MNCFENIVMINNNVLYGSVLKKLKKRIGEIITNPNCSGWSEYSTIKNNRITVLHFRVIVNSTKVIQDKIWLDQLHSYYEIYRVGEHLEVYNFCADYGMQGQTNIGGKKMLSYLISKRKSIYDFAVRSFPRFFKNKKIFKGLEVDNPLFNKLAMYYISAGYMNDLRIRNGILEMWMDPADFESEEKYEKKVRNILGSRTA